MKTNKEVAKEIIISYFENMATKGVINSTGFSELMALKFDEKDKLLLEHIKAIKKIMEDAIKEIEKENENIM